MTNIEILIMQFPGSIQIPATVAGAAIGYAEQTCYNLISKKQFPLPIRKVRRKNMVALHDLAKYMDGMNGVSTAEQPVLEKRKAGRPTKAETIARMRSVN